MEAKEQTCCEPYDNAKTGTKKPHAKKLHMEELLAEKPLIVIIHIA